MVYPGYGRRLVLLAFHCGTRIMELAALQADDIDPDELIVTIGAQLDRNQPWPATRLPKNHKPWIADLRGIGEDNTRSLIADARRRQGPTPDRCSRHCQHHELGRQALRRPIPGRRNLVIETTGTPLTR